LPTAVAGITLTAIYAPNGWIGSHRWQTFRHVLLPIRTPAMLILSFVLLLAINLLQGWNASQRTRKPWASGSKYCGVCAIRPLPASGMSLRRTFQQFIKQCPSLRPRAMAGFGVDVTPRSGADEATVSTPCPAARHFVTDPGVVGAGHHHAGKGQRSARQKMGKSAPAPRILELPRRTVFPAGKFDNSDLLLLSAIFGFPHGNQGQLSRQASS
jgi:hypothetical protein